MRYSIPRWAAIALLAAWTASAALTAPSLPRPVVQEVNLWVARDVAPGPRIRLTLNTRNVPVVRMAAYRLEGALWLVRRSRWEEEPEERRSRPAPPGRPVREWDVTASAGRERPNPAQRDVYRSRQVNLPPLPPGVYLLTARGGAKEAWAVVNITQLAVVVKRAPRRALVWVCDHATGAPLQGARVSLHDRGGRRLVSGTTRPDGTCLLQAPPGDHQTVIAARDRDFAGVPTAIEDPDGVLTVHFQTDRPIYRPGHTVFYKAILRRTAGRGYTPLAKTECGVEVRDAKENVLHTVKAVTNDLGTLSDQVELPSEGVPGPYTVTVTVGKETVYGTFSVAEYRKPEFKVAVTADRRRYLAGEPAAFQLQAGYYFGAPLPQAEVTYQIRRLDAPYAAYDGEERWYASGDGNLYPRDTYAAEPFVAEGRLYTDDAGRVTIPFKTDRAAPDSVYALQCSVQNASQRQVEASASVPVYAAALRLGLRTELLLAPLGSVIPLQLSAADLDGKPSAARVTLSVREPVWVEKEGRYRDRELARTRVSVPASGKAAATVPAAAAGELRIVATARDATGRETSAEISVWVAGAGAKPEKETAEPTLSLRLDRRAYRPGDTARIWVSANTRDRPILVTAEGADLWQYVVVPAGRGGFLWRLKTGLAMSPNAYIGACQWVRGGLHSANALLPLPDASRRLVVKIEPERTSYRPGDPARYRVRTTDPGGSPVSAEVALSVVDEAIFALRPDTTPDPFAFFWGLRPNLTLTVSSAPEELSGGAYQRASGLAPIRRQFLDTAHWDAHVTTGPDGLARVAFAFPGNLTAWRATARGVTADTRAGAATATVRVSRPVMLRLAVPRGVVQGDRLTLIGTVHNRTDQDREFETRLTAEGIRVEGEPVKRVRVATGSEATVVWTLAADTLPESGTARVEGSVLAVGAPPEQREELSDALRVGLRVLPRGIPHRIAAGGVLARETSVTLRLPADRIEPATTVTVAVRAGLRPVIADTVRRVLDSGRNGSLGAANHLLAAAAGGVDARAARDALALLSRFQQAAGDWGWWDDDESDPVITARVLTALALSAGAREGAPAAAVPPISAGLLQRGMRGATEQYNQTNLWEHRALLAAAITLAGRATADRASEGPKLLEEVRRRGSKMSPYARLMLAEALLQSGDREAALALAREVAEAAVAGPATAYLPGGDHPVWEATTAETTALGLMALADLGVEPELQRKLAEWLARPEEGEWRSQDEDALTARALAAYLRRHPDPNRLGAVALTCNGVPVTTNDQRPTTNTSTPNTQHPTPQHPTPNTQHPTPNTPTPAFQRLGESALRFSVPRSLLKDGANLFAFRRDGEGEVFISVEARCYRPAPAEANTGVRVLRRMEARNDAGVWEALRGPVRAADTVRCTVLVWPDDRADGVRVTEPIPAGFELVDSEADTCAREEVRDGAIVHYLRGDGRPVSFRYYLRAESAGELIALPAVAEVLRRPSVRGNSAGEVIRVAAERPRNGEVTADARVVERGRNHR